MKYVNNATFMTARPPRTLRRLIANAAPVATNSVRKPTATAMISEFHICSQKWLR